MKPEKDITGQKYGKLTAIKRVETQKDKKPVWLFQCECGNFHTARKAAVLSGATRSCGKCCHTKPPLNITHGMSKSRVYSVWASMKRRCSEKDKLHYSRYYGRGIRVCKEWQSFDNFWEWAKNNGYSDDLTIDRIDNNRGYSPDNCRWTTTYVQARNKRTNVNITYRGETHCLADWAKIFNIDSRTLGHRFRMGYQGDDLFREVV